MKLSELLKAVPGCRVVKGSAAAAVKGIADSSAEVKKGYLFACVRGFKTDGHRYIKDAVKRGASAVLVSRKVKVPGKITVVKAADNRNAMFGMIEKFYRKDMEKVRVTGITGTKGKTTVSYLVEAILREKTKKRNAVIGTVKYMIGKKEYPAKTTTPSNAVTNRLISEAARAGIKYVSMEVSSHALDQGRVKNIRFDTAVVTNITRDHMDYHKNYRNYLKAKLRIIDNIKKGGRIVVNLDGEGCCEAIKKAKKKKVKIITYSFSKKSDIRVIKSDIGINGSDFTLSVMGKKVRIRSKLMGAHNIGNVMAAIGAAMHEVPVSAAKRAVEKFNTVKGRLDNVYDRGFTVLVDYAHTPDSMENVLKAVRKIRKGKIISVFGAGGNRDRGKRQIMGRIGEKLSDRVIITSDNPRYEEPGRIIRDILRGIRKKEGVIVEPSRTKAIRKGINMASENDIVLIMGKGHETYQEIKGVRIPFDDAKVALNIISEPPGSLKRLLSSLEEYRVLRGSDDIKITSVEDSSKRAVKGSMFICRKGARNDGHDFAKEAVKRGAKVIVVQKEIRIQGRGITVIKVKNTSEALLKITAEFYREIKKKMKVIGVTGTNGKSTVSHLIDSIISEKTKRKNLVIGTIGYRVGNRNYPAVNTTPSNIEIHRLMKMACKKGIRYMIMEVSSHALDQGRTQNIEMDAAVITNITRDHLDYHRSFTNYVKIKSRAAGLVKENGKLVVNIDDRSAKKIGAGFDRRNLVTFSMKRKAGVTARVIKNSVSGTRFRIACAGKSAVLKTTMIGEHNVYNILAAAGAACDITDFRSIKRGVEKYRTIKGRLERIYTNGVTVFIDFAHTPDGLERVISSLNRIKKGRLITVSGASGNRDKGMRPMMGRIAEKLSDRVVVTSDNPRFENPGAIIKGILKGVRNKKNVRVEINRKKAIQAGIKIAQRGDVVLITGKGHQEYQEIKGKKIRFSDRKTALAALKRKSK